MDVFLKRVVVHNRDVLFRLLQYSLFEESATDGNEINADGLYEYPWFELYFTEPDREAYFIKCVGTGELLGFVMVNTYMKGQCAGHAVAEFMVLPKFRRMGIGRLAAQLCFSLYSGYWEVSPSYGSDVAMAFWENVIGETDRSYQWNDGAFLLFLT